MESAVPSPSVVNRIRTILNQAIHEKVLTPAGLAWLTAAVDPWHDTTITGMRGMPDQGTGQSITFQVVQEYQISRANSPVALPPGLWSCRIGNFPTLTTQTMNAGSFYGPVISQLNTPANQSVLVPVQVNYAPDGTDFADTALSGFSANAQGCSLPPEYTAGVLKVCGMGIEVINTTSQLHLQGLVSYARMIQPSVESWTSYIALGGTVPTTNQWTIKSMTPIRTLPKNLSELALYPGYSQDIAKKGYYAPVILRFGRFGDYPVPLGTCLFTEDPQSGPFNAANPIPVYSSNMAALTVPGNTTTFFTTGDIPLYYDCSSNCVIFSGLSEETTLTLRVRWILERFPSDSEKQILVIAQPSADYDPVALEVYSRVVQRMPAGVAFTENPAGEWWAKMLGAIGEVVAPMLSVLPSPIGKALGVAIPVANRALQSAFREESKVVTAQRAEKSARKKRNRDLSKAGLAQPVIQVRPVGGSLAGGGKGGQKKAVIRVKT